MSMGMSDIIKEIGGINMKTIDVVKPVIDEAVKDARSVQMQVEDAKDAVKGDKALDLAKDISQQANPEAENKQLDRDTEAKTVETKAPAKAVNIDKEVDSPDV